MTTKDKLKQRIIDLVPEIEARGASVLIEENGFDGIVNYRRDEINLEDVLRAIMKMLQKRYGNEFAVQDVFGTETKPLTKVEENFERIFWGLIRKWQPNISLDRQNSQTINFLIYILL